jgi:hypothetical protein
VTHKPIPALNETIRESATTEENIMNTHTTTDPISQRDVSNTGEHPCAYMGDGEHGVEVLFESEANRQIFLKEMNETNDPKVLQGSSSEDYVAEG